MTLGRGTTLGLIAVVTALAGVIVGSIRWMALSREELVAQFAREKQQRLEMVAHEVSNALGEVRGDLQFANELLRGADGLDSITREFGALLAVVKSYRALAVFAEDGRPVLWVGDPRAETQLRVEEYGTAARETAMRVMSEEPGAIEVSAILEPDPSGWLRVFATRSSSGRFGATLALIIDTSDVLVPLKLAAGPRGRLAVLGPQDRPTPMSDPRLPARTLAGMMSQLDSGAKLDGSAAARLGFDGEVVVSKDRIDLGRDNGWTVLLFSSTSSLRSHERTLILKLGATTTAIALCLIGFGAFLIVVSRREAAMRERLRQSARLAHLHEKTDKILDNIPSGVLALSRSGRITALNRVLRSRVPNSAIEGTLADAFPLAERGLTARLSALIDSAKTGDRVRSVFGEKLALFGEEGTYSLHAVPLEPRDPEVACLLVIDDVSEVASLSTQLLRAEKLKTVGVLGAGIAHEMGTPLGVIRARAEYILGKIGVEHAQADGLSTIVRQVDQLSRTIRQLLDFSRQRSASVRAVDVSHVAHAVAELLRFETERRKLKLTVEIAPRLPTISADADQLQQALVNLVMNACDACASGGTIHIAATPGDAADRVVLAVSDDGCGIPESHRTQIFDPFFTTKKRGQGTGLGLTLVAQIVRNHGGTIEIASEIDRGTTVSLYWPIGAQLGMEEQRESAH